MTKKGLIRLVVKLEKFIVKVAYQMYKAKLPRLSIRERKKAGRTLVTMYPIGIKDKSGRKIRHMRIGKRKFSRKQLAAQRLFAKRARAGTLRR